MENHYDTQHINKLETVVISTFMKPTWNKTLLCVCFQAYFSHPMVATAVIIHLAADGTTIFDSVQHQTQCNISVQLVDTVDKIHGLGL